MPSYLAMIYLFRGCCGDSGGLVLSIKVRFCCWVLWFLGSFLSMNCVHGCFFLAAFIFSLIFLFVVSRFSLITPFSFIVLLDGSHMCTASMSFPSCDSSPYSIIEYISHHCHYFDAHQFGTMRIVNNQPSMCDRRFIRIAIPPLGVGSDPYATVAVNCQLVAVCT